MKWIAQPPSFYQVKPLSLSGLIYCCVSQTETELMTFHFVPIFNLKFSNTWGGRSPYFASLTDAGNVRVQMEAGFCPSSISQIQITLPSWHNPFIQKIMSSLSVSCLVSAAAARLLLYFFLPFCNMLFNTTAVKKLVLKVFVFWSCIVLSRYTFTA